MAYKNKDAPVVFGRVKSDEVPKEILEKEVEKRQNQEKELAQINHYSHKHGLTLKQLRFCQNYVATGGNGQKSAILAGYKKESAAQQAHLNLKKQNILEKINEIERKNLIAAEVTYEWKVEKLKQMIENCAQFGTNASAVVSAVAELNRMQGHYSPEKTITANLNANAADFDRLEDMMKLYEREY